LEVQDNFGKVIEECKVKFRPEELLLSLFNFVLRWVIRKLKLQIVNAKRLRKGTGPSRSVMESELFTIHPLYGVISFACASIMCINCKVIPVNDSIQHLKTVVRFGLWSRHLGMFVVHPGP
jgi:hypothetical protein